jgi:hypothetical protein
MTWDFTPELEDKICSRLASGESLNKVCKDDDMPTITTVMNWLVKSEQGIEPYHNFLEKYTRAREMQADVIFDECMDIADESGADARYDEKTGQIKVDGETIARAKLRIDTRKWMAGKMRPKKYGERIQSDIQHLDSKGNPTNPPVPSHISSKLDAIADEEY